MQFKKLVAYSSLVSVLALGPAMLGPVAALADNDCHNDTTGPSSSNDCSVQIDNDLDVDVDNDADFDADLDLDFDTGDNTVSYNTTAGDNESGDVEADIEGEVTIDQSAGGLCECFGDLFDSGDNNASNQNTGPHSSNDAHIDIKNDVDVDVDNDADVDLDVDVDADTGGNTSSDNTTVGDTSSGDVKFSFKWTTTINQGL